MTDFHRELKQLEDDIQTFLKLDCFEPLSFIKTLAQSWDFKSKSFLIENHNHVGVDKDKTKKFLEFCFGSHSVIENLTENDYTIKILDFFKTRLYGLYFERLQQFNEQYGQEMKDNLKFAIVCDLNFVKFPRGSEDIICCLWCYHHGIKFVKPYYDHNKTGAYFEIIH